MYHRYIIITSLSILFVLPEYLISQTIVSKTIALDTLNVNSMYKYNNFLKGRLNFKDGSFAVSKFNVNMLTNEIQFINSNGDTLSLADEIINTIDNVMMGDHEYYFKQGAIEVIRNYMDVKLGVNEKYDLKVKANKGAYGELVGNNSNASAGMFYFLDKPFTVSEYKTNIMVKKVVEYYFIKNNMNLILPTSKNNLIKIFREHSQNELSSFVTENKINFKNERDLCRLLYFCESIIHEK